MWKDSIRYIDVILQTTILRIVGFYVRHSAHMLFIENPAVLVFSNLVFRLSNGFNKYYVIYFVFQLRKKTLFLNNKIFSSFLTAQN